MTSANYRVVYSDRRTVGITVERDGEVVVRAPRDLPDDKLQQVLASRRRWIEAKIAAPQKYSKLPPPGKELVAGESILYLGRSYRVEMVDTDSEEIQLTDRFLVPSTLGDSARDKFRIWYRVAAERLLIPRAADRAATLGVTPRRIVIGDNKFRWGSCTSQGTVALNWRLVKAPAPVSDYVIVHELAHLLVPNHGDRFWSIVRSQAPRADTARLWLKEHGQLLEHDL